MLYISGIKEYSYTKETSVLPKKIALKIFVCKKKTST